MNVWRRLSGRRADPRLRKLEEVIGDRWGVTDEEVRRTYPCDDVVPHPTLAAWRGVTVKAPPEAVWPWVAQIRLAPYSYDWVDNLGRRSPRELRGLPEPVPGEPFTRVAGRPTGEVLSADPGRQLTGRILATVMSYVLEPLEDARTRLLMKIVGDVPRLAATPLALGDLVMARRQLLTWKRLAEAR